MNKRIALLIDAENTNCNEIDFILEKASEHGNLIIRRLYGDFTNPGLSCWRDIGQRHGITVAQKFSYRKGKNSTDIELIMEAVELKVLNRVDGIILVAGDSDYTGLALKCRESNIQFIGMGKSEASDVLKKSCQEFVEFPVTDSLTVDMIENTAEGSKLPGLKMVGKINIDDRFSQSERCLKLIKSTVPLFLESDGYASLSKVIDFIRRKYFDFDIKKTGSSSITAFLKKHPERFLIAYRNNNSSIHIKLNN